MNIIAAKIRQILKGIWRINLGEMLYMHIPTNVETLFAIWTVKHDKRVAFFFPLGHLTKRLEATGTIQTKRDYLGYKLIGHSMFSFFK